MELGFGVGRAGSAGEKRSRGRERRPPAPRENSGEESRSARRGEAAAPGAGQRAARGGRTREVLGVCEGEAECQRQPPAEPLGGEGGGGEPRPAGGRPCPRRGQRQGRRTTGPDRRELQRAGRRRLWQSRPVRGWEPGQQRWGREPGAGSQSRWRGAGARESELGPQRRQSRSPMT
ncbi:octapeptide-repeat protein T2-like [Marmota flaviventris]|uniref:octapeptide-repeat protein T2-like n=1 Tax=Marmota flaviventris TaxID=93162 RepID=UPI003A859AFB